MRSARKFTFVLTAMLLIRGMAVAQIPVEVFTGHKKTTLDILFFKFFRNKNGQHSKWLFFNRNRASLDHKMTSTTLLPQFGFTEAISYNHEKLKGFAPVFVTQVFGSGIYPKAGFQYAHMKNKLTLFSWVVCEIKNEPTIDLFFLGRYTPKLTEKLNLFSQLELVNAAPTARSKNYSFTQRIRLGLKVKEFQFGFATDLTETGRTILSNTNNIGVFLRYEY